MSRVPLLRSSPALGTGSYGGVPIQGADYEDSFSLDGGTPAEDPQSPEFAHNMSNSPLRRIMSVDESRGLRSTEESTAHELGKSRSHQGVFSKRRRSSAKRSNHSLGEAWDETVEGGQELGLETRFSGSGLLGFAPGSVVTPESLQSSEESSLLEDGDDENDESSPSSEPNSHKINIPLSPADNSPYAQVRASVMPVDDTTLSINTPRMWTLSILFAIFGSSTNLFFSLRYPSVSITPVIALLIAHPLGLLWDRTLKRRGDPEWIYEYGTLVAQDFTAHEDIDDGDGVARTARTATAFGSAHLSWKSRLRMWLAQGHWNEKEHCCVFISSNVSFGFAFATDVIVEQVKFYNQHAAISYQILLTLSTQILGYAVAGLTRRFLVRPSGMIWPGTLVSTAMFSSLHKEENRAADGWTISRFRFFLRVFLTSVAFYFLPGLLFPALSWFNVVTWFAPKNVVVANLFGVASGLGLFPMTFDWSQIAYIGSPLVVPFWAALNIIGGLVIVMWVMAPIMYYMNIMYSAYLPMLSAAVFDNTGNPYDVSKILTPDFLFDQDAYNNYSRVFLPITYVLSYALQFAALAALLTHTICWHGRDIWRQWQRSLEEIRGEKERSVYQPISANEAPHRNSTQSDRLSSASRIISEGEPGLDNLMTTEDVHNRLMRRYEDVPLWWYGLTGLSMTAIGIFVVEYFPVHLPWYGLLMAIGICAVLFIPIGIVMAITNQQSSLYLICQLICGVVFSGRPVANMVFVTYGYITSTQGLKFSSDLKLGHYMKIPPKLLFTLQLAATVVSSLTQIGVLNWMLANIPGICTPEAINGFTCPIARVHFNGSILWGVVGPANFFGPGALYRPLVWAFLLGAIAPVIIFPLARNNRRSILRKVNLPVLFGSLSWIPPATGLNFSVWAIVCWLFNYVLKSRRPGWWGKYTMTLSAALDSGLAVGVVVVFFGVVYPGWMEGFSWWGTEVYKQGCDWQACAYKTVGPGEKFGPDAW